MSMGVSKPGGRKTTTPEINVTPLVDVMLVLLVIFMITIQAAKESIPLELPEAAGVAGHRIRAAAMVAVGDDPSSPCVGSLLADAERLLACLGLALEGVGCRQRCGVPRIRQDERRQGRPDPDHHRVCGRPGQARQGCGRKEGRQAGRGEEVHHLMLGFF